MTAQAETVLFVDDEEHLRLAATQALELENLHVAAYAEAEKALAQIARQFPGVLVSDIRMPGMDGLALMQRVLEIDPEFPVILVTGHGDVDLAVSSMRDGAYDFIEKPYAPNRLVETVRRALDKRRLTLENRALRAQVGRRDTVEARITGRSQTIVALRQQVRAVAETDADVLITGATGTGKEVVARAMHRASARSDGPFMNINCAALPAELIEIELFGNEAGAFPGAMRARFGKFEAARRGTVFLDEIDSLPLPLQGKLLHAIQNRAITRLGSNEPLSLDVRFVAASKKDLVAEAEAQRFRADLLYRLNVVSLSVPLLAERREDIPLLFSQLVSEAAARYKRPAPDASGAVLSALAARDWPGNVRELRNAADRFVLGLDIGFAQADAPAEENLAAKLAAHEKALIAATLASNGGRLKDCYESLGISRKALYDKMQRFGLSRADYSDED